MTEMFTCTECGLTFESKQVDRQWIDCMFCGNGLSAKQHPHFTSNTRIPAHMTAEFDRVNGSRNDRLREYHKTPEFRKKMLSGERREMLKGEFEE